MYFVSATPSTDWKPKSTNSSPGRVASAAVRSQPESQQTPSEAIPELQRKLEELQISSTQQVVLPNHINVTEAGKLGFCFGSFDASFGLEMAEDGSLESDKSTPLTESSDSTDDPTEMLQLRSLFNLLSSGLLFSLSLSFWVASKVHSILYLSSFLQNITSFPMYLSSSLSPHILSSAPLTSCLAMSLVVSFLAWLIVLWHHILL